MFNFRTNVLAYFKIERNKQKTDNYSGSQEVNKHRRLTWQFLYCVIATFRPTSGPFQVLPL